MKFITIVEPFDPTANPEFKPEKDYKGHMLNREIVLTEQTPQEFAAEHELHMFTEDSVAVNRAIVFRVETSEPTESFNPAKPLQDTAQVAGSHRRRAEQASANRRRDRHRRDPWRQRRTDQGSEGSR